MPAPSSELLAVLERISEAEREQLVCKRTQASLEAETSQATDKHSRLRSQHAKLQTECRSTQAHTTTQSAYSFITALWRHCHRRGLRSSKKEWRYSVRIRRLRVTTSASNSPKMECRHQIDISTNTRSQALRCRLGQVRLKHRIVGGGVCEALRRE